MNITVHRITKVETNGQRPLNADLASGLKYVAVPVESIPTIVRWLFLLFVFTFSFETVNLGSHSVTKIVGLLFFVFYLLHYNPFFRKRSLPRPPAALWWFLIYLSVYTLRGFFSPPDLFDDFYARCLTLVQLLAFFWIASDLLKDAKFVKSVLLTSVIASATLALGIVLQLPGFNVQQVGGRVTALGDNPNGLATSMAVALIIIMGLYLNKNYRHFTSKMFFLLSMAPIFWVMIGTGSRGGIAAFIIGCSIFLLPYWRSKRAMIAVSVAGIAIVVAAYMVASNPNFLERWNRSYYEGDLALREQIFPAGFEMVLERPIFGWHVELFPELGLRLGSWEPSDSHNLFLHLLLEVGMVGTIPFLIGFLLCGWAAWQARRGNLGLLPLALFSMIFVGSLSGNSVALKPVWLVMALAVGAASRRDRESAKQFPVLLMKGAVSPSRRVSLQGAPASAHTKNLV